MFARVMRPGAVLFLSTNNTLCPVQSEFNLPLYSWYPAPLKRRYERLAVTTRPELANYARYPAVNWFTFGMLKRELDRRGLAAMDRFETKGLEPLPVAKRAVLAAVRGLPPLRFMAHVVTPYTIVVAVKR